MRSGAAGTTLATAALCCALLFASATEGRATRDRPPPGHTGGFAEPHCGVCHFEAAANTGPGSLRVTGLPSEYEPETTYTLSVEVAQPGLRAAGFQLAIRSEDGAQAGALAIAGDSTHTAVTTLAGVQYAHHLYDGTIPAAPDTARWLVRWTAPAGGGAVLLHAAANAADGDDSPLGDLIYTTTLRSAAGK